MAKNLPQRERPAARRHGRYAQLGKTQHHYDANLRQRPLSREQRTELHAARVFIFGRGYSGEARDLEALERSGRDRA